MRERGAENVPGLFGRINVSTRTDNAIFSPVERFASLSYSKEE